MKLLLENWREYIKEGTEGSSPLDLEISPNQRILSLPKRWKGFPTDIKQSAKPSDKPNGLWYGCGDTWLKWMKLYMPKWLDDVNYVYELEIDTDNEFMEFITNAKEFKKFEDEFWKSRLWKRLFRKNGEDREFIDWGLFAGAGGGGIEICPYLWDFRMSTSMWYYSWDVASGCIWDPNTLLSEPKLLWQRHPDEEAEEEDETPT